MSLLAVKSLSLIMGRPLLTDLNFGLEPGDRLGVIAPNGRGKSALLRCLAGELAPSAGTVVRARGVTLGLVAQEVPAEMLALPLRAAVAGDLAAEDHWRVDMALEAFEMPLALRDRPLAALSGGWQRMALMARVALREPEILLLDEPTNHLDLERIGLVQRWLAGLPREVAVILTSHDRAFLDATTRRSLFLREGGARIFALPYTRARAALAEADAAQGRRFDNDMAKVGQLRRQAAKLKNIGINSGSDLLTVKTRQLTARADRLAAEARAVPREAAAGEIRLSGAGSHAKALLTLMDAQIAAPDGRALFRTGQKWIEPGDRIVLLGANGAGKSRMVAALVQAAAGGHGAIRVAQSLVLGLSDQGLRQLPPAATPFDLVMEHGTGDGPARSLLAEAGIAVPLQTRPLAPLSGGQKARLALLLLRLARPNFYLLDEPTNHLDIEGQEALEREVLGAEAACLLVSHDRSFVRQVANRFWLIEGRRLVEVEDAEGFFARQLR